MTDEEKRAAALNKGKSQEERACTAWFESEADEPRVSPPDLTVRPDLTAGDVFWHRSRKGVQLWIWLDDGEGLRWKPVNSGHYRDEDGRRLYLTPTGRPSWVREQWFRKKDNKNSTFILSLSVYRCPHVFYSSCLHTETVGLVAQVFKSQAAWRIGDGGAECYGGVRVTPMSRYVCMCNVGNRV